MHGWHSISYPRVLSNVVFPRKVFNEAAFLHAGSFVTFSLMILMIYPFVYKKKTLTEFSVSCIREMCICCTSVHCSTGDLKHTSYHAHFYPYITLWLMDLKIHGHFCFLLIKCFSTIFTWFILLNTNTTLCLQFHNNYFELYSLIFPTKKEKKKRGGNK